MDERLPGWSLARSSLDHLPHDDLFNLGRVHARTGDRVADDHGAQLGSGKRGETTKIAADRGPDGGNDDWGRAIAHVVHPVRVGLRANYAEGAGLSPKLLSRHTCSQGLESKAGGFCGGNAFFVPEPNHRPALTRGGLITQAP